MRTHGTERAGDDTEPIGEEANVDVETLPDLLAPDQERDVRGRVGFRRFAHASLRWAVLAAIAGLAAGVGASLFIVGLNLMIRGVDHLRNAVPWWAIVAFPPTGALVVGYLLWRADRVAFVSACGTDSFIDAVEEAEGHIPARVPLLRIIGAWLTIGFGGSSGRECPMIYTGAGLGSTTGQLLRRARQVRYPNRWRDGSISARPTPGCSPCAAQPVRSEPSSPPPSAAPSSPSRSPTAATSTWTCSCPPWCRRLPATWWAG